MSIDVQLEAQPLVDTQRLDGVAAGGRTDQAGTPERRKQPAAANQHVAFVVAHDEVVHAVAGSHHDAFRRVTQFDLNTHLSPSITLHGPAMDVSQAWCQARHSAWSVVRAAGVNLDLGMRRVQMIEQFAYPVATLARNISGDVKNLPTPRMLVVDDE